MAKPVKRKKQVRKPKSKFDVAVMEKVKEMRTKKNVSQETVATILQKSKGFIGQIETPSNASKYNLNHLNRLAKELGCSPQDLIPKRYIQEDDWVDID